MPRVLDYDKVRNRTTLAPIELLWNFNQRRGELNKVLTDAGIFVSGVEVINLKPEEKQAIIEKSEDMNKGIKDAGARSPITYRVANSEEFFSSVVRNCDKVSKENKEALLRELNPPRGLGVVAAAAA